MIELENPQLLQARLKVFGVGGGGGNAVNNMISAKLKGVEFIAANTDAQDLKSSNASTRIQLGASLTRGLGAGANPETGREAAQEAAREISEAVDGADMVFIAAGLGGGTGTGGGPVIAEIAREKGILTVGVVTKPFQFEGRRRMRLAEEGLLQLKEQVDSLIVIPNDRLMGVAGKHMKLTDAFKMVDQVLRDAVQGISDLITVGGLINVDFADVRAVMSLRGMSLMGTGIDEGEDRAAEAAQKAISSPLLDSLSIQGARGVLVNISGGEDLSLQEVNEACTIIEEEAHEDAMIIFGTVIDPDLEGRVRVTVIATGFEEQCAQAPTETETLRRAVNAPEDLETPTFMRERAGRSEPGPSRSIRPVGGARELDEAELDVPTFFRRKPD